MRNDAPMDRSSKVRVLGSIALVLFCLNLLIFVDRNFGQGQDAEVTGRCGEELEDLRTTWTPARQSGPLYFFKPEHAAAQRYWSKPHRKWSYFTPANATPINEELRIRAAHPSEADEALRNKLGLTGQATAHIPIMR